LTTCALVVYIGNAMQQCCEVDINRLKIAVGVIFSGLIVC